MHINKIHLVNFRGMTDLTVNFKPGVNIIIGDNGAENILIGFVNSFV